MTPSTIFKILFRRNCSPSTGKQLALHFLVLDDQMVWTVGKARDVGIALIVVVRNNKNVMLAVAASTWQMIRYSNHRLHRNDHARLQNRIAVFAQLEPSFTTIVVAKDPERVALTKAAVLK